MNRLRATTMFRNGLILATAFLFPALLEAQQPAPKTDVPKAYALVHAKIFTLAGAPIENGTLIIRDGKIAAVGGQVDVPQDAQVINGEGLQIYPGMFDPITQMGLREIGAVSSTVDSTETGNYNPDVVALTAVSPSSEHIPGNARRGHHRSSGSASERRHGFFRTDRSHRRTGLRDLFGGLDS